MVFEVFPLVRICNEMMALRDMSKCYGVFMANTWSNVGMRHGPQGTVERLVNCSIQGSIINANHEPKMQVMLAGSITELNSSNHMIYINGTVPWNIHWPHDLFCWIQMHSAWFVGGSLGIKLYADVSCDATYSLWSENNYFMRRVNFPWVNEFRGNLSRGGNIRFPLGRN